jgi:3-oxoacyl-(acyl-carrier-protein) synthase
VREINITLWRHEQAEDWSVEIDGKFSRHVSATFIDELVEYALVAAEQALLEPEHRVITMQRSASAPSGVEPSYSSPKLQVPF